MYVEINSNLFILRKKSRIMQKANICCNNFFKVFSINKLCVLNYVKLSDADLRNR